MTTRKNHRAPMRSSVRAACDRCHETKSRCARAPGSFECERCSRLGNLCAYSAPLPMGRPKEKAMSRSSGSLSREYAHTYSHKTQAEWKKHRKATQRTCGSIHFGNGSHNLPSPPSSSSNVANSILLVASTEDPQRLVSDSWLPDWPSGEFDLDSMMQTDFTPPPDHLATFSSTISSQLQDSLSALSTPDSMTNPTSGVWDIPSNPISSNDDSRQEELEGSSEGSSDTSDGCLHQLLRLQSDLFQITSLVSDTSSVSHITFEDPMSPASSSSLGKTGMPSLDMILGCTQTLIEILHGSHSSFSPVLQSHGGSTGASHRYYQLYSRLVNNSVAPSIGRLNNRVDVVTTLLSLSCYSSLLVAYDRLVASLLSSSNNPSERPTTQVPSSSPSLKLGNFSITARSTLFISTVLHIVKEMLEQLQCIFQVMFGSQSNVRSEVAAPVNSTLYSAGQNIEGCATAGHSSPVISAAHSVLVDISEKEKRLMEILTTNRSTQWLKPGKLALTEDE